MFTKEGKELDTKNVKYMTFDGVEFALFPVLSIVQKKFFPTDAKEEKVGNALQAALFEDEYSPSKTHKNSVAYRVRQWLSNAKVGQSTIIEAPTAYSIRVACETRGVKAKIFQQKRGSYRVIFDSRKKYARQKGV